VKLVVAFIISLSLLGCAGVKLSQEGRNIRAMTEIDKPNCEFISNSATWSGWVHGWFDVTPDQVFESGFNAAMNGVASAGGDAYVIVWNDTGGAVYEVEAWRCRWSDSKTVDNFQRAPELQEISASERGRCAYIKTIAEASNWGITKSRNYKGAKKSALNLVKKAGGDSYYVVHEVNNRHIVGLIIEAWRCN
jgi:hypothetical protein